jgi:hypothetical protein
MFGLISGDYESTSANVLDYMYKFVCNFRLAR